MENLKSKKYIFGGIFLIISMLTLLLFVFSLIKTNNNSILISSNTVDTSTSDILLKNSIIEEEIKKEDIPQIATEEKASEEELKKEKVTKKEVKTSSSPYYIKVNYGANTVTIYKKDSDGKYTVPVKAMVCSCGTATPRSGTYKTSSKYRWGKLIHDVYGQYATRIVGSILFHSVPYSSNTNDSLLYNQYDKLGTKASAGCIRLTVADAKWIYSNCPSGTMVEFYSSSNPGPLGKPTAQKISSNEECRNWDPTDPAEGNPWHTHKSNEENVNNNIEHNNSVSSNIIQNNTTINNSSVNTTTQDNSSINNNSTSNNTVQDNSSTNNNSTSNNTVQNNSSANNNSTSNNTVQDNSSVNNNSTSNNTVQDNSSVNNNSSSNNTVQNNSSANNNYENQIENITKPSVNTITQNQI